MILLISSSAAYAVSHVDLVGVDCSVKQLLIGILEVLANRHEGDKWLAITEEANANAVFRGKIWRQIVRCMLNESGCNEWRTEEDKL